MINLNEVDLRTDISRKAAGFAYKKFLGKHVNEIKKNLDSGAKRMLKQHSTMEDGRKVYHAIDADGHHHYSVTDHDNNVVAHVNMIKSGKAHKIDMAVAQPGAGVHKLYHHLITKHNHIITSDAQSHGGLSIWQKMRKMGGVNVHGYHPKTGRAEHVDIVHRPELSHVSNKNLESQRKVKGGTISTRKKEYADLKKTHSMILVAHKDRNKKPLKSVRESTVSTVLRIIRESREE
jgi:hypothetical protein